MYLDKIYNSTSPNISLSHDVLSKVWKCAWQRVKGGRDESVQRRLTSRSIVGVVTGGVGGVYLLGDGYIRAATHSDSCLLSVNTFIQQYFSLWLYYTFKMYREYHQIVIHIIMSNIVYNPNKHIFMCLSIFTIIDFVQINNS